MNTIQVGPRNSICQHNTPAISRSRTAATRQRLQRRGGSVAAQKRILVVDDHRHSREGLRESLLGEGYQVEAAADGWQAIKKVKEGRFEVAIIDLDLPPVHGVDISGWDLVRICRAFHPAITVIVVSAEAGQAVMARAEELKVAKVLEKPIDPTQLKAIFRTLNL
jgi:CheY-like chemotaxis protein